ncbi:MAG: hypothetical protein R3F19_04335 [Verrucomicrobiales bacterium]
MTAAGSYDGIYRLKNITQSGTSPAPSYTFVYAWLRQPDQADGRRRCQRLHRPGQSRADCRPPAAAGHSITTTKSPLQAMAAW